MASIVVGLGDDGEETSKSHSTAEMDLEEATKERGCMVGQAPQEDVLTHFGGFLTHSGWNSTLESIVEGTPFVGYI